MAKKNKSAISNPKSTIPKPSLPELKHLILQIWPMSLERSEVRQLAADARAADDPEKWLRDLAKLAETQAEPLAKVPDPKSPLSTALEKVRAAETKFANAIEEYVNPQIPIDDDHGIEYVTIRIPVLRSNGKEVYLPRKLETQLDRRTSQATALRDIRAGLNYSGARLANGSHVDKFAEAARWLLEQVAIEIEKLSPSKA